jgi:N6-L-threonylcarbamoyladenine synthase
MRVLGIESSCDESAAAVVEDGRRIVANVVATQADIHAKYGGVVPEVASRRHLETIIPVVESALEQAGGWEQVDAIGATYGPGLAGSLLVGLNAGKSLAFARGLPFIGVNHLEGHIYANWLETYPGEQAPEFPALALVVSGGHTDLILMEDHGRYRRIGRTRDDAAGEAFDKVARLLDLGYPGGPVIERVATGVAPAWTLPRAWLSGTHDFSFSGLKTAVLHLTREPEHPPAPEIAAAFQQSVVDVLAGKTAAAAKEFGVKVVMLAGGVASNGALREAITARSPVPVRYPPPRYCTDNAVMIAACAYFHLSNGERSGFDLDVEPNLRFAT